MKKRFSGPNLFLLELLFVILVFAFCAAICVRVFVSARLSADDSSALNHAVLMCESGAECFKIAEGDLDYTAGLLGWSMVGGEAVAYYDPDWQPTDQTYGYYRAVLTAEGQNGSLHEGRVRVEYYTPGNSALNGKEVFSLQVLAREGII